ncbi:hypothetical protein PR048_010644 [Dryococelus australis]|uniref:Uncharacterized protein n=1 Tax=Dryococelus australis TaxID=614101 RepID=A0ABQ9I4D3_9NEOP|nr:hypothetical protein PR048_010644 [Dryococelus australis]
MIDDFSEEVKIFPYHIFDNLSTGLNQLASLRDQVYGGTDTVRENRIPMLCPITSKNILLKKERAYHELSIVKLSGIYSIELSWYSVRSKAVFSESKVQLPFHFGEYK